MNPVILLSSAAEWLLRLPRRWQEAGEARRAFEQLSSMSEYELRDIGITHGSIAAQSRFFSRGE